MPVAELTATGGEAGAGRGCGNTGAPTSAVPPTARRAQAHCAPSLYQGTPAMAVGARTRAGAYRVGRAGGGAWARGRRGAINAENAKPNADMIQSSAARRVW